MAALAAVQIFSILTPIKLSVWQITLLLSSRLFFQREQVSSIGQSLMAALKTLGHAFVNTDNSAFYAEQQIADSHIYRQ